MEEHGQDTQAGLGLGQQKWFGVAPTPSRKRNKYEEKIKGQRRGTKGGNGCGGLGRKKQKRHEKMRLGERLKKGATKA